MKENSKNIIIILLILIIILLGTLLVLLTTGTLTLNKVEEKNTVKEKKETKEEINPQEEEKYIITYEEEEYTTKKSDGTQVSKSTRNLPKIINSQNQTAADKIVKYLTDISNKEWNESIKKMADQVAEDNVPYTGLGVTYLYETGIETDNRLTFILKLNGGFGGVGWLSEEGYNFDKKTGDILTIETIAIDPTKLKEYITTKSIEKIEELKKNEGKCIIDNYQSNLEEELNKVGNWYFASNEIKIRLQKYSIACGAGGITEIDIPKEEINQYIKEEYKI